MFQDIKNAISYSIGVVGFYKDNPIYLPRPPHICRYYLTAHSECFYDCRWESLLEAWIDEYIDRRIKLFHNPIMGFCSQKVHMFIYSEFMSELLEMDSFFAITHDF